MTVQCYLHIDEKHQILNIKAWEYALAELSEGGYIATFETSKKRTNLQNAYFHACIIPLVFQGLRDNGFDEVKSKDDAKKVIKAVFLKSQIVNKNTGEVIDIIRDTHELTTMEFNQLIDDVVKWAAEYLSLTIPMPGQQAKIFNLNQPQTF